MKYRLIIISLLLLGFACNAQNKIDKQGRRQGKWIKTDKDGSRIFEGTFQDGKEVGVFNYYYPDGTLKIRNTFTVPGRYCRHEAYDQKGHRLADGYYDQKNRDSVWHFYNEDGKVIKVTSYRMGIKQGRQVIFNSKGDTAEVSGWKDNHRNGRWWKRIGDKGYITGYYVNGGIHGRLVEYGEDGNMIREGFYNNGARHGQNKIYEAGKLVVDEMWNNDLLAERKILLHAPAERWVSVFEIAYFMPKGSFGTNVYLSDGTKLTCSDSPEIINERVGSDNFVIVDRRYRIIANKNSVVGITKDSEGRNILELSPKSPFTVFPDEECLKLVKSLKRPDALDE